MKNLFDFVSQERISQLPENPELAFVQIVDAARTKLQEMARDPRAREREYLQDVQYSYLNIIVGVAKQHGISDLSKYQIPSLSTFSKDDFRRFEAELEHVIAQLFFKNATPANSLILSPNAKRQIRTYVSGLRDLIQRSELDEKTKARLLSRLDEFEAEIDKKRFNLLAAAWLTFEILAIPGALYSSYEVSTKLLTKITETIVAEAEHNEVPLFPEREKRPEIAPPVKKETEGEDLTP